MWMYDEYMGYMWMYDGHMRMYDGYMVIYLDLW